MWLRPLTRPELATAPLFVSAAADCSVFIVDGINTHTHRHREDMKAIETHAHILWSELQRYI